MRIIARPEFLKMPQGTVYQKFVPNVTVEPLCVKERTLDNDWLYFEVNGAGLLPFAVGGPHIAGHVYQYPSEPGLGRDGCFEPDTQLFLVYDPADLMNMSNVLLAAMKNLMAEELKPDERVDHNRQRHWDLVGPQRQVSHDEVVGVVKLAWNKRKRVAISHDEALRITLPIVKATMLVCGAGRAHVTIGRYRDGIEVQQRTGPDFVVLLRNVMPWIPKSCISCGEPLICEHLSKVDTCPDCPPF